MTSITCIIPEELLFRVFTHISDLNDLCSIRRVCKQFDKIACNLSAYDISRIAWRTGQHERRPRLTHHLLLVATASDVAEWAIQSDERRHALNLAMTGGIDRLVTFSLAIAPATPEKLFSVHHWMQNALLPFCKDLERAYTPVSQEQQLTLIDNTQAITMLWVIYGEMFQHGILPNTEPRCYAPLDCITRFLYVIYCLPDSECFRNLNIAEPTWFKDTEHEEHRRLQSSLQFALRPGGGLSAQDFERQLFHLQGIAASAPFNDGSLELDSAERVMVAVVSGAGRKSLEVLTSCTDVESSKAYFQKRELLEWLTQTWLNVNELFESECAESIWQLRNFDDIWLKPYTATLEIDLQFTLWGNLIYDPRGSRSEDWPDKHIFADSLRTKLRTCALVARYSVEAPW